MYRVPIRSITRITGVLFIPLALLIVTTQAFAAINPADLGIATQYTHLVFGDVSLTNGKVAAPVAYEGNVSLQNNNIGKLDGICNPADNALTIGGNLNYTNTSVYDGNGLVGGSITSGGGTGVECGTVATGTVTFDFDAAELVAQGSATTLAASPTSGDLDMKSCNSKLVGENSDFNVYSITPTVLANANPGFDCLLILQASCGSIDVINVSGTTFDTSDLKIVRFGGVEPSQIVFNFYEATNITFAGGELNGTILAPYAHINMLPSQSMNHVIHNGGIVAKSLSGSVFSAVHPFGAQPTQCQPPANTYDFGDLPTDYPTQLIQNGARHILTGTLVLGTAVDADIDGVPTKSADGDDLEELNDDDGVQTNPANWLEGLNPNGFGVTASEAGCLNGWIDWDEDGDFDDVGDKVFDNVQLSAGLNSLSFIAPTATVNGTKYARFRISSLDGNSGCSVEIHPTGEVLGGEVEDYRYENPLTLAVGLQSAETTSHLHPMFIALLFALLLLVSQLLYVFNLRRKR